MKRLTLLALALAGSVLAAPDGFAETGNLSLTVAGIKDARGAMMIAVYDQAGYDTDKAVANAMVPVAGASLTTSFQLPPGRYGVKLFHDVDGDGKMGTNPFGMPIEPYAFSNNAEGRFGPAKWDAAAFELPAGASAHTITFKGQ